jgi:glucose-6-phosphate isomerase
VLNPASLLTRFDPGTGVIEGAARTERRLSDLRGIFADPGAYERALAEGDPIVYTVHAFEPGGGEGDLHYGVGTIMPGRVGDEYYMTKGHFHSWRPAAEFYIGLRGRGMMLLEGEDGNALALPLEPNGVVYVPGNTAHRTVNTGSEPLVYIGVYPARAGHDYGAIAERNFRQVVAAVDGDARVLDRDEYLARLG